MNATCFFFHCKLQALGGNFATIVEHAFKWDFSFVAFPMLIPLAAIGNNCTVYAHVLVQIEIRKAMK